MRPPETFQVVSIHLPRRRPTLRAAQNDHRPARTERLAGTPRLVLDLADLQDALFQRCRHRLVHAARIAALDEIRCVAVADEQRLQLLMADAGQERRVIDLVAVEVQDRQHGAVRDRVEELIAVPAGRERTGFSFAVAHHDQSDQDPGCRRRSRRRARCCSPARRPRGCCREFPESQWLPIPPGKKTA